LNGLYTALNDCESIACYFETNEPELSKIEGKEKTLSKCDPKWHKIGPFGSSVLVGPQYLEYDLLAV
jgi:hypothetical protein